MMIEQLLKTLKSAPESITFEQVMAVIAGSYHYTPVNFTNGKGESKVNNEAGTNEGSCKIFSFGLLNNLDEKETLACFGHFYREEVLNNPTGTDHANIRNFMKYGWLGIHFEQTALIIK